MTESPTEAFSRQNVGERMFAGLGVPPRVVVALPYPPSQNGLFRKHNGSRLSEKYRLWRDEAGWMVASQRPGKIAGPVSISVKLCAPDKRRRDLDNVGFKAVIDLLVSHQIIEADDSRIVRKIQAEWALKGDPCRVEILPI